MTTPNPRQVHPFTHPTTGERLHCIQLTEEQTQLYRTNPEFCVKVIRSAEVLATKQDHPAFVFAFGGHVVIQVASTGPSPPKPPAMDKATTLDDVDVAILKHARERAMELGITSAQLAQSLVDGFLESGEPVDRSMDVLMRAAGLMHRKARQTIPEVKDLTYPTVLRRHADYLESPEGKAEEAS